MHYVSTCLALLLVLIGAGQAEADLYAGGDFTTAGGVTANRIAGWNGTSWSALGVGANDNVYSIAVSGSDVGEKGVRTIFGTLAHGGAGLLFGRLRVSRQAILAENSSDPFLPPHATCSFLLRLV